MRRPLHPTAVCLVWAACLTASVLAMGCAAKQHAERADEIVEIPASDVDFQGLGAERWCSDFGQAGLDAMIERTWAENMALRAAWARVEQARATIDVESAALYPNVGVNGEFGIGADGAGGQSSPGNVKTAWELSVSASYEIDLWNRLGHRVTAAELEAVAADADARALAITLTSEVAEAWFDVVAYRARLELFDEQLELARDAVELMRLRFRKGQGSALDVVQQEQLLESIRGARIASETLGELAEHRLDVLMGQPPGTTRGEVAAVTLPEIEPIEGEGVPADLLDRRPDVRAAWLLLYAADERSAAAAADRLPRLQLSAGVGLGGEKFVGFLEQLFWDLGMGITQPIFDGGRLAAEQRRTEAVAEERLYLYADALLVAMREVLDALAVEQIQHDRIESLERELALARDALELANARRLKLDDFDYLRVLTAQQSLQNLQLALLDARRQQISNRIGLCRALGGTWAEEL